MRRICLLFLLFVTPVSYSLDLELTQGVYAALPIGVNSFVGTDAAHKLVDVVKNDLRLSGQFKMVNPSNLAQLPVQTWRQYGADSVLSGEVREISGNRYSIQFELLDAAAHGRLLLAKTYIIHAKELRSLAHHISDEVYQKLTGVKGIFSTRIAYILVQRHGNKTRYSLEVAGVDGFNPQSLLVSSEPIMSPSWSPDGRKIAFVSFENKRAQIYIASVETGKRQLVTNFSGINGAPAWSPDGRELAVVLSKEGTPKIYTIQLSNGRMKQLTFGKAIDTEPRYSPDGQSLLFTSGRGGAPQVYSLSFSTGKIVRVSFDGNYNARASYTPDKKNIVMLHREDRYFNIGVQNTATGRISQLTNSPMDESPSVAPNGRLVLYATQFQNRGVLAIVSIDGRIRMRLPSPEGDVQEPTWSPYLG